MKIFQFNRSRFIKFFFIIFFQKVIKGIRTNLLREQDIHAATVQTACLSLETDIQLREKEQICG